MRDLYTAVVRMMDSGDKIKIDQALLETVIPAIGQLVFMYTIDSLVPRAMRV